jgi:2-methylcitrate dehydratase PrpD
VTTMSTADSSDVTRSVVQALMGISFSMLPSSAVHVAKRMLLDGAGCAIAGSADVQFEPLAAYARGFATEGSTPGPLGRHYDVATAAWMSGVATHILDYDDVQTTMGGHPTSTLLPVVLSLGFALGSSGEEVIRAVVLATELDARLGRAMNPAHYGVGWHPTDVIGSLGTAFASAILLSLDVDTTCAAIGMAASYAAGSKANFGTTTKSLHAGLAARAGVESALLTQNGATANTRMLDDQFGGYFNLYTPEVDRDILLDGIGNDFIVVNPGVSFKLLPCCGSIHSSAWAAIGLHEEGNYDVDTIVAIRAFVDPKRIAHTSRTHVTTGLEAKFSSQYCQAVGALTGKLTLADFDDEVVMRPERQDLLRRVSVLPASDVAEWPNPDDSHTGSRGALVEIEDASGRVAAKFQLVPRGYAADPASDEVLMAKFADCASRDGRELALIEELGAYIMQLEKKPNVRQLSERVWNI